jgi:hypothetical protein
MDKEEIIRKYRKKLEDALCGADNETAHEDYDSTLEELIRELGYGELLDYAEKLIEERNITFWYA